MKSLVVDIIRNELTPEFWQEGYPSFLVAEPRWQQMRKRTHLPVVHRKLQGPRKVVRKFTFSGWTAQWPNDKMIEARAPLLMWVLKGQTDYCCGDYMIQVPAGYAVLVPSEVPRRDGNASLLDIGDNRSRYSDNILFGERRGSLQIWINRDRGNEHHRATRNETLMLNSPQAIRLLNEMNEEATAKRLHYEVMLRRLAELFFWSLQRALQEERFLLPGRVSNREVSPISEYDPILSARQYIRENFTEPLTQDRVARAVRLSRTQFIRRFHEETGQTFHQFLSACRLEHAKVLLEETDFTLRYIHEALGFQSATYFNRFFKKHTGMLPREYRGTKRDQKDELLTDSEV